MSEKIRGFEREYSEEVFRLIEDFQERLRAGTATAEAFLSISDIELLWSELRFNTSEIYSDMLQDMLSSADESDLIRKKKRSTREKE